VFLVPDNESGAERRMRRMRRLSWAAMIAVVIGATYIFRRGQLPPPSSQVADTEPAAANAVVSPAVVSPAVVTPRRSAQPPSSRLGPGRADNASGGKLSPAAGTQRGRRRSLTPRRQREADSAAAEEMKRPRPLRRRWLARSRAAATGRRRHRRARLRSAAARALPPAGRGGACRALAPPHRPG
jgi:hypothetical protein